MADRVSQTSQSCELPLLDHPGNPGRSTLTCVFRCGNACARPAPNPTDNEYFGDIVARQLSRRGMLRASAAGSLVVGLELAGMSTVEQAGAQAPDPSGRPGHGGGRGRLTFEPVPPNTRDAVTTADGYTCEVVLSWGDPVEPGAPEFDFDDQSARAQAKQFGYNCDYVAFLPMGRDRALLWVNHEYTDEVLMFRGYRGGRHATEEQIRIGMAAHGGSVVEIERVGGSGRWRPSRSKRPFNRRITAHTEMRLTGPAAASNLVTTDADPRGRTVAGMLNNCSGGTTPWGTVLTCEENFHQYFVGGDTSRVPEKARAALERYGFTTGQRLPEDGYRGWERVEERFDIAKHPNEPNRFGWVVEIDPFTPHDTPRKHTALGRFKHEAANTALARDRRAVVYMGDDEKFDYIYKFVSKRRYRPGRGPWHRRHNSRLLEEGTLYVARFGGDSPAGEIDGSGRLPADGAFDGAGEWVPLASGDRSHVPGMSAAEVLVHTRLAADRVGATRMDRPEDMERNPVNGAVYVSLTNNDDRTATQAGEANPRAANKNGHIMELVEDGDDAAATRFRWSLPVLCGDPEDPSTYFAGFDKQKVSPISAPDNLAFDRAGNLWIATDGNELGSNDGLFAMPVQGKERGYVRQFLTVPVGAETCGPLITSDQRTCFVAVQHPGEVDGATPQHPASRWPDGDQPRPSVVSVWRSGSGPKRIGA